jgi:DNA-directed RNA polymerase subunit N (RpoN/RPB10)
MRDFKNYKIRILESATDRDILDEIGYCYKRAVIDEFDKKSYWTKCYNFLTKLAREKGLKAYC